jgi:hypothetical protein
MAMPLHLDGEALTHLVQETSGVKKCEVPTLRWQARRVVRSGPWGRHCRQPGDVRARA